MNAVIPRGQLLPLPSRMGSVISAKSRNATKMNGKRLRTAAIFLLGLWVPTLAPAPALGEQKFRSDEWITECDNDPGRGIPDCSITVPFVQAGVGPKARFPRVLTLE